MELWGYGVQNPRVTDFTDGDHQRYHCEDESKGWGVRSRRGKISSIV